MIRIGHVCNPFPIVRKHWIYGGDARKVRNKLLRVGVVANEFTSTPGTNGKNLFSVPARSQARIGEWTVREAYGSAGIPKKSLFCREHPNVRSTFVPALKHEVLSIWSPHAATYGRHVLSFFQ